MKKIILSGYMASGKSTIGRLLAQAADLSFIDLDEYIAQKAQKSIQEIFTVQGEIAFRKLEHKSLAEIVKNTGGFVLALGGGTPCYAGNDAFLKRDDVVSVYLKAGIQELVKRIEMQEVQRPLLAGILPEELKEFVATHLFERSYFYHQSKHVVTVDHKSPEAIVNEIMSLF